MSGDAPKPHPEIRHATAVALSGRGVLIVGASHSGKSSLALELVARGFKLISDDLVRIGVDAEGWPVLTSTGRMAGVIEARGVGLLRVPHIGNAPLALVIDMDQTETERLPETHYVTVQNTQVPSLHRVDSPAFPASIWALMTGGRSA